MTPHQMYFLSETIVQALDNGTPLPTLSHDEWQSIATLLASASVPAQPLNFFDLIFGNFRKRGS